MSEEDPLPPTASGQPTPIAPATAADEAAVPARAGRYEVVGLIARGGMGAVYKVLDPELGRSLALKVLLDCHQGRPDLHRRFLEEAQIGGQLQHPGLVPVHELGLLPDERPYFTMKLVKGTTLAQMLSERPSPAAGLLRFLTIFEQMCQTLAYAHSQGVIHRDMKPSNVMVGAFGEVQVMDWGLAKFLNQQSPQPIGATGTSTIYSSRASGEDDSATRAGTVLGTPAYMPPEQARGQVDHLDERADVFGLGAILCEILTSRPPYSGTREQVAARAAQGDLAEARARLQGGGADAELIGLALRCLAFQPLERPANAEAVAVALTAYREGVAQRLRQADLEKAATTARALEERKRRRLRQMLVALILVVAVGAGASWLWLDRKRAAAEREVELVLEKAAQLQAEEKWAEALAAARQAEGLLEGGGRSTSLKERVAERIAEINLVQRLDEIQLELADATGNYLLAFDTTSNQVGGRMLDAEYGKALGRFGLDVDRLSVGQAADRLRTSPVLASVLAVLDNWAIARRRSRPRDDADCRRLFALARELDPDPWRGRLRDALALNDPPALRKLADEADVPLQPPTALRVLGEELARLGDYPAGITLLRRAQRQYPGNVLLNARLARLLHSQRPPQWDEALRFATAAAALRPRSPGLLAEYAFLLWRRGRHDECIAVLEKAVALDPDHVVSVADLAFRLLEKGTGKLLSPCCVRPWTFPAGLCAADPDNDLHHHGEGLVLLKLGDLDAASKALRKAVELNPRFSQNQVNLGEALFRLGLLDEAVRASWEAARLDPDDFMMPNFLAFFLVEQGGPLEEALQAIHHSLQLNPLSADNRLTLAEVLRAQGKVRESLEAYRLGYKLHEAGSQRWEWSSQVPQWVKEAERLVKLDEQLPAVLKAERKPAGAAEHAEYGQLCVYKRLYAASTAFYQQAFVLDAKLADDLAAGHRYQAARAAAMAGCGHDAGNDKLEEAARAGWRRQAREWLSADLALRRERLASGKPGDRPAVLYALNHMRTHDHLAGVRTPGRLAQVPKEERAAWQELWSAVTALRDEADAPKK